VFGEDRTRAGWPQLSAKWVFYCSRCGDSLQMIAMANRCYGRVMVEIHRPSRPQENNLLPNAIDRSCSGYLLYNITCFITKQCIQYYIAINVTSYRFNNRSVFVCDNSRMDDYRKINSLHFTTWWCSSVVDLNVGLWLAPDLQLMGNHFYG